MLSLFTVFGLMMLPAIAMLFISFVVSVFEAKSNVFTTSQSHTLTQSLA